MKRVLVVISLLAVCCFSTSAVSGSSGTYVWLPPAQYDHKPKIRVIEKTADYWSVDQVCRSHMGVAFAQMGRGSNGRFEACAIQSKKTCTIIIPRVDANVDAETQARLRRLEIGHCNGWPNDHADGE